MTEKEFPAISVYQVYLCDECGEEMKSTGMVYATNPYQYPHQCINGHTVVLGKSYPRYHFHVDPAADV